jgi:hypothetical protein
MVKGFGGGAMRGCREGKELEKERYNKTYIQCYTICSDI